MVNLFNVKFYQIPQKTNVPKINCYTDHLIVTNYLCKQLIVCFLFIGLICDSLTNGQFYSPSSPSSSSSSSSSFLPSSMVTNLWNQLTSSTGNRRQDVPPINPEQLEQGPLFVGGSFDFDLNELAHLIQPMFNLIKNSEIIKVDQGGNRGNQMNSGNQVNGNNNNNEQLITSASSNRPGLTFSPSFGLGSTQIKPLITLAVPEIEFLNNNNEANRNTNNNNNNNNLNSDYNGNNNQQLNSQRISSNHQLINRYNGRPIQTIDPFLASASGDLSPLTSSSLNLNGINRGSSSSNGRRKKKRKPNNNKNKNRNKPLIQIVDDDQEETDQSNDEEEDSLIPMSSNNNGDESGDDDNRKDTDESQALDQILEMGLPSFLMEEIFGLNKRLLKPGKILAHLTFGALARGMIKRFFKTFLARSMPDRGGLIRRVADQGCRSVKGLGLRDSVILPLGVAVTLHPIFTPFMPAMLFALGSLKAIESATCYVSNALR